MSDKWDRWMMATGDQEFRPRCDHGWWLAVSQRVLTDVMGLVSRGKSEAAQDLIEAYWTRWRA